LSRNRMPIITLNRCVSVVKGLGVRRVGFLFLSFFANKLQKGMIFTHQLTLFGQRFLLFFCFEHTFDL
jgi:hypothetical protein